MSDLWSEEFAQSVKGFTGKQTLTKIKELLESCVGDIEVYSSYRITVDMFKHDQNIKILIYYHSEQDDERVGEIIDLFYYFFIPWFGIDESITSDMFCCKVEIDDFTDPLEYDLIGFLHAKDETPEVIYKEGVWYL